MGLDSPILSNCSHIKMTGWEKEVAQGKGMRYPNTSHDPLVESLANCSCPVEGKVAGPLGVLDHSYLLPSHRQCCAEVSPTPRRSQWEERSSVSLLTVSHC